MHSIILKLCLHVILTNASAEPRTRSAVVMKLAAIIIRGTLADTSYVHTSTVLFGAMQSGIYSALVYMM